MHAASPLSHSLIPSFSHSLLFDYQIFYYVYPNISI